MAPRLRLCARPPAKWRRSDGAGEIYLAGWDRRRQEARRPSPPPPRPAPPFLNPFGGPARAPAPQPAPLGFGRGSPGKEAQRRAAALLSARVSFGVSPRKAASSPSCRRGPTWSGWCVAASEPSPALPSLGRLKTCGLQLPGFPSQPRLKQTRKDRPAWLGFALKSQMGVGVGQPPPSS